MPHLPATYDALLAAARPRLLHGAAELDALLDAGPADTRRGLTLLVRPPGPVLASLAAATAQLRQLEPDQYYQPPADLHLTVLSLISCVPGFTLADVEPAAYEARPADVLAATPPFTVELRGLTASAGGVLVQGFPPGPALADLRERLRAAFRASGLRQSIDQRYAIQTAHLTLARFRAPLRQPAQLLRAIDGFRQQAFGTFEVAAVELVFNDWYQQAAHTVLLRRLPLGGAGQAGL